MRYLSTALAVLISGAAFAQETPQTPEEQFMALDADRNGVIERQEAQADPNLSNAFAQADQNADGMLSYSEYHQLATAQYDQTPNEEEAE